MKITTNLDRVTANTAYAVNEIIGQQTERNIAYYAEHPEEIEARLIELDDEWDIERVIEAQAAGISLISAALGVLVSRKWFFVPALAGGFLLQHARKGAHPMLPALRKLGVRTVDEINHERFALKAVRGDFNEITSANTIDGEHNAENVSKRVLEVIKQ